MSGCHKSEVVGSSVALPEKVEISLAGSALDEYGKRHAT